jgi:hypothetical protein
MIFCFSTSLSLFLQQLLPWCSGKFFMSYSNDIIWKWTMEGMSIIQLFKKNNRVCFFFVFVTGSRIERIAHGFMEHGHVLDLQFGPWDNIRDGISSASYFVYPRIIFFLVLTKEYCFFLSDPMFVYSFR